MDLDGDLHTPGATTIAAVVDALGVQPGNVLKAYPVVTESRGLVMAFVRGDHRVNDVKLANALGEAFRPARDDELQGPGGFLGPTANAPTLWDDGDRPRAGLRDGRQPPRLPPRGHRRRWRARRRAQRRGRRHRQRPADPHRAGHRDRQHLQARHALLRAAGGHLPRRERQGAAHPHGLLRHRAGPHRRPPRSSSTPTRRGSRGRGRSRRGTWRSWPSASRARRSATPPRGSTPSSAMPG